MHFTLALFPAGSLSESVITTVWLGVWVIVAFNQWLGWPLSGLIVPGYLVPLMILKPISASVIFVEAVCSYFLVWFIFKFLPRFGWFQVFGRDRFFVIVMVSVMVRVLFDYYLLPDLGEYLFQQWRITFSYRSQMHSFGLIIVALLANQFWKPGLIRGLVPVLSTLLVTFVLVRFVLLVYTNFTISSIEYLYEDVSSDIMASPKAYIILLSASFISSRMNMLYGWEFNGILIPSLLALMWYQPLKLVVTLVETIVILWMAYGALALLKGRLGTIEGGIKLLLFFNLGFLYKWALGFFLIYLAPDTKVTDFFGFGYLITTLMAVKIHDKNIFLRMTQATFQVSFAAALFANIMGYALTYLPSFSEQAATEQAPLAVSSSFDDTLQNHKLFLYRAHIADDIREPSASELDTFTDVLRQLLRLAPNASQLSALSNDLDGLNYQLSVLENRYFYLHEKPPIQGWGLYMIDSQASNDLNVTVPAPLTEWKSMEAALVLTKHLGVRSLAINSLSDRKIQASGINPLSAQRSFITTFYRVMGLNKTLFVRGLSLKMQETLAVELDEYDKSENRSVVFFKGHFAADLDPAHLGELIGPYYFRTDSPWPNFHRELSSFGFAEVFLSKESLKQLLFLDRGQDTHAESPLEQAGLLERDLLDNEAPFAAVGSELYVPPELGELLFLDDEILSPLTDLALKFDHFSEKNIVQDLALAAASASAIGMQLTIFHDEVSHTKFVILRDREASPKYWGTFVIRLGSAQPYVIQLPRAVVEASTYEFGISQFQRLEARALMIVAAHPHANAERLADPLALGNIYTAFNQVHQSLLRAIDEPLLVLQIRARANKLAPNAQCDILLASDRSVVPVKRLRPVELALVVQLEADHYSLGFVDGRSETVGYDVAGPQVNFLQHLPRHALMNLWLSQDLRRSFRTRQENRRLLAQFQALSIENEEMFLAQALSNGAIDRGPTARPPTDDVLRYLNHYDIIVLERLSRLQNIKLRLITDVTSKQMYLLLSTLHGSPLLLANLTGRHFEQPVVCQIDVLLSTQLQEFIDRRLGLFQWQALP